MARPTRRKLKFDEESVNKLLQEIYDESHNIRSKIARLFSKWESKTKENGEIAAIGDQIVKLIAAEAKNQDQKIMLLKYLKEVVFDIKSNKGKDDDNPENLGVVTSEKRNELLSFIESEVERREKTKNKDK